MSSLYATRDLFIARIPVPLYRILASVMGRYGSVARHYRESSRNGTRPDLRRLPHPGLGLEQDPSDQPVSRPYFHRYVGMQRTFITSIGAGTYWLYINQFQRYKCYNNVEAILAVPSIVAYQWLYIADRITELSSVTKTNLSDELRASYLTILRTVMETSIDVRYISEVHNHSVDNLRKHALNLALRGSYLTLDALLALLTHRFGSQVEDGGVAFSHQILGSSLVHPVAMSEVEAAKLAKDDMALSIYAKYGVRP